MEGTSQEHQGLSSQDHGHRLGSKQEVHFGCTVNPHNPPMPGDVLNGQADFNKQVDCYHKWLNSVKVTRANGEVANLGLQERIDLMERCVIKQAQELQNTKALFVADMKGLQEELTHAKAQQVQAQRQPVQGSDIKAALTQATSKLSDMLNDFQSNLSLTVVDFLCHQLDAADVLADPHQIKSSADEALRSHCDDFTMALLQWQEAFVKEIQGPQPVAACPLPTAAPRPPQAAVPLVSSGALQKSSSYLPDDALQASAPHAPAAASLHQKAEVVVPPLRLPKTTLLVSGTLLPDMGSAVIHILTVYPTPYSWIVPPPLVVS